MCETIIPQKEGDALRKGKIKAGKAMFVLKTTVEEDLEYIRDAKTLKVSWDIFATLPPGKRCTTSTPGKPVNEDPARRHDGHQLFYEGKNFVS